MTSIDDPGWDDPDLAVQIEDGDPESLAGEEVDFSPDDDEDDEGQAPAAAPEVGDRMTVGAITYVAADAGDGWICWEVAPDEGGV